VVEDFTIEHDPDIALGVRHRLMSASDVNDRQSALAQSDISIAVLSAAVWPTVENLVRHGVYRLGGRR